jgi:hypothetical protein
MLGMQDELSEDSSEKHNEEDRKDLEKWEWTAPLNETKS